METLFERAMKLVLQNRQAADKPLKKGAEKPQDHYAKPHLYLLDKSFVFHKNFSLCVFGNARFEKRFRVGRSRRQNQTVVRAFLAENSA